MKSSILRHHQVKKYLLSGIGNGSWGVGERLPSENELVDLCKVSRMTARRALQELLHDGLLIRIKGKGSFVAKEKQQASLLQIKNIATEISERGMQHSSQLYCLEEVVVNSSIGSEMRTASGEKVFHSQLVHFQNNQAIQLEKRWVSCKNVPDYLIQDFTKITPNEYLTKIAPVTEVKHSVEATNADGQIRDLLDVEKLEAILLLKRTTWCGDRLISYAELFHPGNQFSLSNQFKREL
jgi:GntR family histidine utilization transcriptional repressor